MNGDFAAGRSTREMLQDAMCQWRLNFVRSRSLWNLTLAGATHCCQTFPSFARKDSVRWFLTKKKFESVRSSAPKSMLS